ncbi:MAG: DUF7522 family protein [Halobacteriota archaeon]
MTEAPLSEEGAEQLTRTCRTTIGDSCRSVMYFDPTNYMQVYLREDLEQDADQMSFIGHEWHDFKTTTDAYRGSELGRYRYTIRTFENGYLVRAGTENAGVYVTTDGLTMQDFEALATAIVSLLEEWDAAT